MIFERSLNYDDICLIPRFSTVETRRNVKLRTNFLGQGFDMPIAISNMATLSNKQMIDKALLWNIPIFLNRMKMLEEYDLELIEEYGMITPDVKKVIIPTIGVGAKYLDLAQRISGYNIICVDVAHCHAKHVIDFIKELRKVWSGKIIAGNIVTIEAAQDLAEIKVDAVKVGIGNGRNCSTKLMTGFTRGQVTALNEIRNCGVEIIADGGFRHYGDFTKALALGASMCMTGSIFAGCQESSGKRIKIKGETYIDYYGNASRVSKENAGYPTINIEGVENPVKINGTFDDVMKNIADALRSACSYCGVDSIDKISTQARIEVMS